AKLNRMGVGGQVAMAPINAAAWTARKMMQTMLFGLWHPTATTFMNLASDLNNTIHQTAHGDWASAGRSALRTAGYAVGATPIHDLVMAEKIRNAFSLPASDLTPEQVELRDKMIK